jgi:hypothetical protein
MTRSPLRRSSTLRRTALARGISALRRTPLRRQSERHAAGQRELARIKALLRARSGGRCEIAAPGCTGFGADPHHRLARSAGGTHALDNLLHCCGACHRFVHTHPAEAAKRGWVVLRNAHRNIKEGS